MKQTVCRAPAAGVAAWHILSSLTHPQQLLVLLLQLALQVPHSLLNAPVTLFRLQMEETAHTGQKRAR